MHDESMGRILVQKADNPDLLKITESPSFCGSNFIFYGLYLEKNTFN